MKFHWLSRSGLFVLASVLAGMVKAGDPRADQAALGHAFAHLQSYGWGDSRDSLNAIDEAIHASYGNPARRQALEDRLAAVLTTGASAAAKQFVCDRLSLIGSARSVASVTELLAHPDLSHSARLALERIPAPQASAALRSALPQLEGKLKIGVINSLGSLEDQNAAGVLTNLLTSGDSEITAAAAAALGRIANLETVRALGQFRSTAPEALRSVATHAWLTGAERLVQKGFAKDAAAVFQQLYSSQSAAPVRLAGFIGLVDTQPDSAADLISGALAGTDDAVRSVAARILARGPNAPALEPFVRAFPSYPPAGQLALLEACRLRAAAEGRAVALNALSDGEPSIRLAALRMLAVTGRPDDLPVLLRYATAGSGDQISAARSALNQIPGKELNAAIAKALGTASSQQSIVLIQALAVRGAAEISPAVAERLADASEPVRFAALEALGTLGEIEQVFAVINALNAASSERMFEAAEGTLQAIADRVGSECAAPILATLRDAKGKLRMVLLRVLGTAAGDKALEFIRAALDDPDPPTRETALRVLIEWPKAEAAPELLRLSQSCDNLYLGLLALRGYIRLSRTEANPAQRRRLLEASLTLAKTAAQKRLVIDALGELRDPSVVRSLEPFLADPDLVEIAAFAIVTLASEADLKHRDGMLPALDKVIQRTSNHELADRARKILDRLETNPR